MSGKNISRYRPVSIKMWGDGNFRRLSAPQPNGQTLWTYLLTGEHTTALPGAFVAGEASLAEALGWPMKGFQKAFGEVLALGMAERDVKARLVFLPHAVKHNPPQSPNVVKAWRKAFNELPDCSLKQRIFETTIAQLKALGFGEAFTEAFGEAFPYTFAESEQNRTVTEQNRTEREREGERASAPLPEPKLKFGEFGHVRLTVLEHEKLRAKLNGLTASYIDELDLYGEKHPKKFAEHSSHYATILTWYYRAVKEGKHGTSQRINGNSETPGATSERKTRAGDPVYIPKQ